MIVYPNAKINLGLNVIEKRSDGFHNIETVFYPISWKDILEIILDETKESGITLISSGIVIPGAVEENLCVRAYNLISKDYPMPGVKIHLHKLIPLGAGLGGGSSDAAFFIKGINDLFDLNLAWGEMHHYAKQLGADCSFFITNKPAFAAGKGDQLESCTVSLKGYSVVVVYLGIHCNTSDAYRNVQPTKLAISLEELISVTTIDKWKDVITNDFEKNVFEKFPAIEAVKLKMYNLGAIFSGMSGSGSAVYGIFDGRSSFKDAFSGNLVWEENL